MSSMKYTTITAKRIAIFLALYSIYLVLLMITLLKIYVPYNALNISMVIYPSVQPLILLIILLTLGLGFSYLGTGSLLEYISVLLVSIYILWLTHPEIGLAGVMLVLSLPLVITLAPIVLHTIRKNKSIEPLFSKSSVCISTGVKPLFIIGYISGIGIGYSIQGLFGWLTIYNSWLYWLSGVLASSLLGLCFFYYNPVLLGLSSSFSVFSLPLSVVLGLTSPLRISFKGKDLDVGGVVGGLYFWCKLDSLEPPFNYNKGTVSWHWAMISSSKLYLDFAIESPGKPNLNTIVIGRSGSGKSMLTKRLVTYFSAKGHKVLVLDFHGEYDEGFLENSVTVDFWNKDYYLDFKAINGNEEFKAQVIADAFKSIYNLGDRQYTMLYDVLIDYFSIENAENLSKYIPRSLLSLAGSSGISDKSSIIGLTQYVRQLEYLFEGKTPVNLLLEGEKNMIIDLSGIPGMHLRIATAELVLRILYNTMAKMPQTNRRLLVVEEAHHFSNNSILSKLYTESRKFGLAIISITQNPKVLPRDIVINSTSKFMFGMDEPENLDYMLKILTPLDRDQSMILRKTLSSLPPGYTMFDNKLISKDIWLIKVF
ncbi:MAG: DUF87 domain-containing protein [Desulfurococcales archaeon]|nr:DUF87 domain-containing protein [Desulfurococcales archaeon]